MVQLELEQKQLESDLQKPHSTSLSKKKWKARKDIEERIGKRWREVEDDLDTRIQNAMERRHWLIRSSPQMLAVAEMILAGEKPMTIVRFLREKDSERFGENISDDALLRQVLRFKEEVLVALEGEEGDDVSTSRLDFYARLPGKEHVDIHAMMVKMVLFQESRLSAAWVRENDCFHAWMRNKGDRREEKKMVKAQKECAKELDQYWKFLMSLATYEIVSQPCSSEQFESMRQVMKYQRGYLMR